MAHPLDNVIWSALTSHQSALAEGQAGARRFRPAYAGFAALDATSEPAFGDLAALMGAGESAALLVRTDLDPPPALFEVLALRDVLQMVGPVIAGSPIATSITPLGPADLPEMLALVELTQPGPFGPRGAELGRFLGVRVGGELAAMAGERLHLSGYTEVSAVCTAPAFRGRGHARTLIGAVSTAIAARAETPFLHVFDDNRSAIALYLKLGFTVRTALRLNVLRRR
jgi:ribosomal protein S18 acetylase RimI-like enzyme